jgi:curved DNA-binding protein CbpA
VSDDPFALLGLPTRADLSDDDVRAAWRRIAAATHPDRDDGGDPARFGAAAAAYAMLRTGDGRGEALADLGGDGGDPRPWPRSRPAGRHFRDAGRVFTGRAFTGRSFTGIAPAHGRHGGAGQRSAARRTSVLAVRAAVIPAVAVLAFLAAGWAPSSIGVLAGVLTWLLVTAGRAVTRRRSHW